MRTDKTVNIKGNGTRLNVSDVEISKGNSEQVKWVSEIGQAATIAFAKSPFKKGGETFTVKPHGTTPSGPIDRDAKAGGEKYKYTVTALTYDPLDPNVIVQN